MLYLKAGKPAGYRDDGFYYQSEQMDEKMVEIYLGMEKGKIILSAYNAELQNGFKTVELFAAGNVYMILATFPRKNAKRLAKIAGRLDGLVPSIVEAVKAGNPKKVLELTRVEIMDGAAEHLAI